MYYRRFSRMFPYYALKYFTAKGVLSEAFYRHTPKFAMEDPPRDYYKPPPSPKKGLDDKLINRLFLKYPDLKYEPIARKKYPGQPLTTFTYAFAFISEQKKLIKQGYSIQKAFEAVEKMYHAKLQRKLDQTLLSRGLAIGNRARSILTVYQQQCEYESRLKTMRTRRELEKYLIKHQNIVAKAEDQLEQVQEGQQGQDEFSYFAADEEHNASKQTTAEYQTALYEDEPLSYERIFHRVTDADLKKDKDAVVEQGTYRKYSTTIEEGKDRNTQVDELQSKFKNLFGHLYERAGSKDRLGGLRDGDILKQIRSSPNRVKKHSLEILDLVRSHGVTIALDKGEVRLAGKHIPDWIQTFSTKPQVKMALLYEQLNWERPTKQAYLINKETDSLILAEQKKLKTIVPQPKTQDQLEQIKFNKKKQYEVVVEEEIPYSKGSYKLYQSQEERLLRLEVKYYDMLSYEITQKRKLREEQNKIEEGEKNTLAQEHMLQTEAQTLEQLNVLRKTTIDKFRRLKYRLEQRHRAMARQDLFFSEHETIKERLKFEESVEYEELIGYLRKKNEDRRLTSFAQANDSRINKYLEQITISEAPQSEGDLKVEY